MLICVSLGLFGNCEGDNFENMIEKVCHEAMPRIIKKYLNEGFIKLPKQVETEIRVF